MDNNLLKPSDKEKSGISLELIKSPIWEIVESAENLQSFQKNIIPEFYFGKQVPEDIQHSFSIIHKILIHSYFEYEFIDIALTNAVFTLEKALKIRYQELNNKEWKGNFYNLIDWFYKQGYFEIYNDLIIHQLRDIRNGKVHDINRTLGGLAFLHKISTPIDLINDLYEDLNLRKKRKELLAIEQNRFSELFQHGSILSYDNQRLIIGYVHPIFINNKNNEMVNSITFIPIFDPTPYKNNQHFAPRMINVKLKELQIDVVNNYLTGIEIETNNKVELISISDEVNRGKYLAWKKDFEEVPETDKSVIQLAIRMELNKFFIDCRRLLFKS